MAGLSFIIVFALLTWVGIARGWRASAVVLWAVLLGIAAANTTVGTSLYGVTTNALAAIWTAGITAVNQVVA